MASALPGWRASQRCVHANASAGSPSASNARASCSHHTPRGITAAMARSTAAAASRSVFSEARRSLGFGAARGPIVTGLRGVPLRRGVDDRGERRERPGRRRIGLARLLRRAPREPATRPRAGRDRTRPRAAPSGARAAPAPRAARARRRAPPRGRAAWRGAAPRSRPRGARAPPRAAASSSSSARASSPRRRAIAASPKRARVASTRGAAPSQPLAEHLLQRVEVPRAVRGALEREEDGAVRRDGARELGQRGHVRADLAGPALQDGDDPAQRLDARLGEGAPCSRGAAAS